MKNPQKELLVCVSWVVGNADTEGTCIAMLYKHLLQPVNSDKFQFICLEFDHPLMTDCIPSTHSSTFQAFCTLWPDTFWRDRRQNEPPCGSMGMVDSACCPLYLFWGLCFLASASGSTLCIVSQLLALFRLHYNVIIPSFFLSVTENFYMNNLCSPAQRFC